MTNSVMVVLSNYKRPSNMPAVIRAWREQTTPPARLIVVDNSPYNAGGDLREGYPGLMLSNADDIWRFTQNLGCSARFAPALMIHDCEYVIFADDDCLPGKNAITNVLAEAKKLDNWFATLGQIGRNFRLDLPEGQRYVYGNALPGKVHLTCRCYLVQQKHIIAFLLMRERMLNSIYGREAAKLVDIHDDIQLCLGIQDRHVLPSYVLNFSQEEDKLIKTNLPQAGPEAVYRRSEHLAERCKMIDIAIACGWSPVV